MELSWLSMLRLPPLRVSVLVGLGLLGLVLGGCVFGVRGVPASEGLENFARVNAGLWRGAQPDERGIERLKQLGAATIINLRMANDVRPDEVAAAKRLGLGYYNVPLHGLSAPTEADVDRVLALIATAKPPVFIHCQHGADRTGTIIACYRMTHDGWTAQHAMAEAKQHGFSGWQFGMKRFVLAYPSHGHAAIPVAP